ncbi:MAG: hypothetical protein QM621_12055 [Aeromicrobium sp.]
MIESKRIDELEPGARVMLPVMSTAAAGLRRSLDGTVERLVERDVLVVRLMEAETVLQVVDTLLHRLIGLDRDEDADGAARTQEEHLVLGGLVHEVAEHGTGLACDPSRSELLVDGLAGADVRHADDGHLVVDPEATR